VPLSAHKPDGRLRAEEDFQVSRFIQPFVRRFAVQEAVDGGEYLRVIHESILELRQRALP
jgi:hypothetical protein